MVEEDPNIYRLEGSSNEIGGLITIKKPSEVVFKKPKTSLLGLDKLAEQKQRERDLKRSSPDRLEHHREKKYRRPQDETPTYTGGVDKRAQEKLKDRLKNQRCEFKDLLV